ncbi:hypothetical protein [Bythopirellula polymerisocia]|uniref:PEP-CTERM protein-sorting domain-containing protein n=1 Tax=Bythopirellula polymerisocia TaxID=2528003 RepID=A0A5C6D351_9BACT|nr:hypothetical protein [Bythopirellula polymerisocia]TWU30284.1 hypothetical protein Pla144_10700 [Bythopirellula polymerisocia]
MVRTQRILLVVAIAICLAPLAQAGLMHPDVMGANVWFRNIDESSPSGDPTPLYGQPAANGNELIFPTTGNFSASSLDGGPSDQTDGKLSLMIVAKPGSTINSFSINESGLVLLDAPFGGDAFASVNAFGVVKVAEIAGVPVNIPAFNIFLNSSPLNGQYQLSTIGGSSYASAWQSSALVGLPLNTTKVNLTIDNNLLATTNAQATRAFIDKKSFEIDVNTDIPEPHTLLLGIAGILAMTASRRRGVA